MMQVDSNLDKNELMNIPYEHLPAAILQQEKENQAITL